MPLIFEPIDLKLWEPYQEKLHQCAQIPSDYSFINLWSWGPNYGLEWAWEDNLVWLRQTRPHTALWAPVGDWMRADWSDVLTDAASVSRHLIRVPEMLKKQWLQEKKINIVAAETRDQWDYLYSIEELVNLKGNRFHKKKNLVNQFRKKYDFTYLPFEPNLVTQILAMQESWCAWRDCENNDMLTAENQAISRILIDWIKLPHLIGGALQVDNELIAYTIAEKLPNQTLVVHFEKGSPDHKGSYQAINQIFLSHAPTDCTIVNREQDLGDEGLRKAKLSYNPIDFIRKYQVTIS